ncbi:MAG: right-handed parallel beta-helix repeat-containing protein [Methanobacteriota archaeon]
MAPARLRVLVVALLALPVLGAPPGTGQQLPSECQPQLPPTSPPRNMTGGTAFLPYDWIVKGEEVRENETILIRGSLALCPGARLVLRNVNASFESPRGFPVELAMYPGSKWELYGSAGNGTVIRSTGLRMLFANSDHTDFISIGTAEHPVEIRDLYGVSSGATKRFPLPAFTDGLNFQTSGTVFLANTTLTRTGSGLLVGKGVSVTVVDARIDGNDGDIGVFVHGMLTMRRTFVNASVTGIVAARNEEPIVIEDSEIVTGVHGILLYGGNATVRGTAIASLYAGVRLHSNSSATIENSTFVNHDFAITADGLRVGGGIPYRLVARGNEIFGRGGSMAGVALVNATYALIEDNQILDHQLNALVADDTARVEVVGNRIRGHGDFGLRFYNTSYVESGNDWGNRSSGPGRVIEAAPVRARLVNASTPVPNATLVLRADADNRTIAAFRTDAEGFTSRAPLPVRTVNATGAAAEYSYTYFLRDGNETRNWTVTPAAAGSLVVLDLAPTPDRPWLALAAGAVLIAAVAGLALYMISRRRGPPELPPPPAP